MKKIWLCLIIAVCSWTAFAQDMTLPVKIVSYQISRRQTSALYERAEIIISDETQSWQIILYRKDGTDPEQILLEKFDDIGNHIGVFRTITIKEGNKTSGSELFAYLPVFEGNNIRIDLCDKRTEGVKRRLIVSVAL